MNRQVITYIVTVVLAIVLVIRGEDTRTEVKEIKRDTVTLTPCLKGSDRSCQVFLNRLLKAATPEQIRKLRGKPKLTAKKVRQIIREETQGGSLGGAPPPG